MASDPLFHPELHFNQFQQRNGVALGNNNTISATGESQADAVGALRMDVHDRMLRYKDDCVVYIRHDVPPKSEKQSSARFNKTAVSQGSIGAILSGRFSEEDLES